MDLNELCTYEEYTMKVVLSVFIHWVTAESVNKFLN